MSRLVARISAIYVFTTIVVPGRLALADAAQAREDQARHLSTPDSFGSWHRFTGAASNQRADQIRQQLAQVADGPGADQTVYAEYRSSEVAAVVTGVNSTQADDLGRQLGEDPKGAVLSLMAGLGSLDPVERDSGALGGAMLCAAGYEQAQLAHCAWGDAITVAVVFFDPRVDVDEAADLTGEIREGVTVLD